MNRQDLIYLCSGIEIGLKKAKDLFRQSTDAKGSCKLLSQGESCQCFLCLVDSELTKTDKVITSQE